MRRLARQADRVKGSAGLTAVAGPGVTVTLSDAPQSTSQDTPDTVSNPNLLLVHQQDIQAVVNAMWKGGARAVTIQGQRVVSTTGIRCIGNSVQLQGVPYSQPYRIQAVGDVTALTNAIANDPYLVVYRADAADPAINVGWDEQVEQHHHRSGVRRADRPAVRPGAPEQQRRRLSVRSPATSGARSAARWARRSASSASSAGSSTP